MRSNNDDYLELSFQEKVTILMTISFNMMMGAISGTENHVYVNVCIIQKIGNDLILMYGTNGIEFSGFSDHVSGEADKEDVINKIQEMAEELEERNSQYKELQMHPMRTAEQFYCDHKAEWYYIPMACSMGWPVGVFMDMLCKEFTKRWMRAMTDLKEMIISDSDTFAVAARAINIEDMVLKVCNDLIPIRKTHRWDSKNYCQLFDRLSEMKYESRECIGTIGIIRNMRTCADIVCFQRPLDAYRAYERGIRKLLEMTASGGMLILDTQNDKIVGITEKRNKKVDAVVKFSNNGWMLIKGKSIILRYQKGKHLAEYPRETLMEEITKERVPWITNIEGIRSLVKKASMQKHGTGMIISNNIERERDRLTRTNRCIPIESINLIKNPEYIIPFSSIDGALLVKETGECVAIGAILDGVATITGKASRGARFNSLLNYIAWKKNRCCEEKYLAIIISEDGSIDCFSTDDKLEN